jgi:hypothetical protein
LNRPEIKANQRPVITRQPRPIIERQPRPVIGQSLRAVVREMPPQQALNLAILLCEYEITEPVVNPVPPGWVKELDAAPKTLAKLRDELCPAGEPA